MSSNMELKQLNNKQKEDLLKEILGKDYAASSKNIPTLKKAIDYVGYVDNAFTLAELIPVANSILSNNRLLSVAGSGATMLSAFLFPVSALIDIAHAYQIGHKMYSFRSIAYTLTAWAYNKPIPASSMRILSNIREGRAVKKQKEVAEYNQIWTKTSQGTLTKLSTDLALKNIPKEAMQLTLRAISNNDPKRLCEILLKGFEDKLEYIPRLTWKSNYSIIFPA